MWEIEKIVKKGHYNYAVVRGHPKASRFGYVLEHRVVMENTLGRLLLPTEIVHHINGDKKDNRACNLTVLSLEDHARMHGLSQGKCFLTLECPQCGMIFTRARNQIVYKKSMHNFCSRSCSGKYNAKNP